jgi:hypothetical protein
MSYSHHFSGVVFFSDLPYNKIEASFRDFCELWSGRLDKHDLILRHENEDWDDEARRSRNANGEQTEVEVYIHKCNVDGKATYGLMEWVREVMSDWVGGKKQVMRVYCSSRSDAVKDDPFFYIVTKGAIDAISVDALFKGRRLKVQRQSAD